MQKIQAQLKRELEALSKVQVKHRVEGYRITESARALLSSQRDRHAYAMQWRADLLRILGDDLGTSVRTIHAKAIWMRKYSSWKIYSSVNGDVALVKHNGAQRAAVCRLEAGESVDRFLTRYYGPDYKWFAK